MPLFFNIAGPCVPGEHYIIDPMRGINDELMELINSKQYFLIHAARQSGKTTLLQELTRNLNSIGQYFALYCSLEALGEVSEPNEGIPLIIKRIAACIKNLGLPQGFSKDADYSDYTGVLNTSLVDYCRSLDKPLVIFFDEADCLSNGTLVTFLRQLRDGYINRTNIPFVHSIVLVGMRNLRDYKVQVRLESQTLGTASPFNIVTKYINLKNFRKTEVAELYAQHTAETGQIFEPDALDYIYKQTYGQPWLVNAIAREMVMELTRKDYSKPITKKLAEQAIQNIILARGTHFDSLIKILREQRVRKIIEPLILGEEVADKTSDDYLYTRDVGLIREIGSINAGSRTEVANPIYAEIIIRSLNQGVQDSIMNTYMEYQLPRYLKDGRLDMDYLIKDFQTYWRENSDIWKEKYRTELYQYDEAATHLVLQAFLQRVINSGGKVNREIALGTKRADLCIDYGERKYPIELKLLHNIRNYENALSQIAEYADKCGSDSGWLVIFDRDTKKSWDDKIYVKEENLNGKRIFVAGC